MQDFGEQNAHIIEDTDPNMILLRLSSIGISSGHFNNGTFTLPKDKFAPAFLAAYQRVLDVRNDHSTPLIVAINSDKSMKDSFAGKDDEADLVASLTPQQDRAENVINLLSHMFPGRKAAVLFYDEQTPYELYETLCNGNFDMKSLHKVGFGTSQNDKPIIGAEFFNWVYACPLPFDEKPVMHKDTRDVNSTDRHPDLVEKLTEVIGPHGKPYITKEGKLLFPLPPALQKYAAPLHGGPTPEAPSA